MKTSNFYANSRTRQVTSNHTRELFTTRATLCAIGIKLRALKFFDTIAEHVHIKQKTIRHTPVEKLHDAFIAILAGAHGLCEINTRLRSDESLQRAFGRSSCAEQSVVRQTLNACTPRNVIEMHQAVDLIFRQHSKAYRHDYRRRWQLLDLDMTGLPCGNRRETTLSDSLIVRSRLFCWSPSANHLLEAI